MPEATAVSLPTDIIFDILSRTPTKTVCRFRCVSKGWHGLISDQAFLAAHKLRHIDPLLVDTGFFRGNKKRDLRLMDMDGNIVRVFEGIGGSGMFPTTSLDNLISVWDGSCEGVHHGHESCESIRVVDPATGGVLFTSPGHEVIEDDFTEYYKVFSIGRATPSGVYKVVRLNGGDTCDVATLGDDTGWRRKTWPRPVPTYRLDHGCCPVTINGVMYFLIEGTSDLTLQCFDLESERWKDDTIKGPQAVGGAETWSRSKIPVYITELNGSLCLAKNIKAGFPSFAEDMRWGEERRRREKEAVVAEERKQALLRRKLLILQISLASEWAIRQMAKGWRP
ncbi:F-box protein At1g67130-like [Lolium perenne]|uniref:F-box protein At1g67130-like n=1 Tax=Lolium perenne TaxID=4522 RepID=UPI003A98DF30